MKLLLVGGLESAANLTQVLSRLKVKIDVAASEAEIRAALARNPEAVVFDADICGADSAKKEKIARRLKAAGKGFLLLSSQKSLTDITRMQRAGASDYILKPFGTREFIMRLDAVRLKKTRVACIGGGTGLFTLLLGLKTLPNTLLTSVVNMSDDGGSSGKLSQSFGILPPGDIRRSLVALSNAPVLMNQIIQHRFDRGGELKGHSFGNIFLTVLAEVKGSMSEAVRALSDILNIQGVVLPSTRTLTSLSAKFENGLVIKGESKIDLCEGRSPDLRITKLWHDPKPECDLDACAAILHADLVTIGPGDLYTSVITNLALEDMRQALASTRAKKIYICNLMTKPGETTDFDAYDHVKEILKYLKGDYLDYVLISNTQVSGESIREYSKKHQSPVIIKNVARIRKITRAQVLLADIGNETELVRHDSIKLRNEIERIISRAQKKRHK